MLLNKIKVAAIALLVGLGVMASGAALLTRPTAAAQPSRSEATGTALLVERPVSSPAEGYVHIDSSEMSADRYKAVFCKTLGVVAEHFGQITYANAYNGRIEARQPINNQTAVVELRAAEDGGYWVNVRAFHEAAEGKPARRDVDLERVILQRLCAQPEGRPNQTIPSRVREPVYSENDPIRRLQKEVDELRERVRALERKLSDRENNVSPRPKTVGER
jgi:hypothetical protein